ncbi:MAG: thermosome subunit [Nanoarchaeota archaeon]|nr:thermosome subunit [Nanoarchaeota archaeon]
MTENQQPVLILPEGYQRMIGRGAQGANIAAAKAVAETVRTTLGPKGMDKMLVDSIGDIVVTNDGVTILEEMNIENPAAKMIVEVAKTQDAEVGDGTTTAVVIAGELLKKAEDLLDQNVHPTVIAKGYNLAGERAEKLLEKIKVKIDLTDNVSLRNVAMTAMTGKNAETDKEVLAKIVVNAVKSIIEEKSGKPFIENDNIKIEKKSGGSVQDSKLINGIVIDKERVHSEMPSEVKNAKILLLSEALEVKETERSTEIRVNTPDQLKAFMDQEETYLKDIVSKVKVTGANVVFCQKGIDDVAQYFLAKANILAVRRVKKSDVEKLAKATGAKIVSNLDESSVKDLGFAGEVFEKKISGEDMMFVSKCKNPKAVTIFVRGGTEHIVDEIERAVIDALGDLKAVIEEGTVVYGAGAPEIELAQGLRKYAQSLKGREQLAVNKFAEALEIIPKTLAENAGLDPIDVLTELKALHDNGKISFGINVFTGKSEDMSKLGVVEPSKIKSQAIKSATEVAMLILRIDDVIASGKMKEPPMPPQGGMGGGMPGMY